MVGWSVGLPSVCPSGQAGTVVRPRPHVRSGAATVTDNNARFFDNLRRPRRPRRATLARAPRRKEAAARDHRDHLLNGKKQTRRRRSAPRPQSVRTPHKEDLQSFLASWSSCSLGVGFHFISPKRSPTSLANEAVQYRNEWHDMIT